VAEGIESGSQADVLRELGFEYGQGFHFPRPAPAADFELRLCAGGVGAHELELVVELGSQG
jgi:EAL domain-containing protein (putative c-di-GMP-specific phosphodiesterase class I)